MWSSLVCHSLGWGFNLALPRFPPVVRIETTNSCNARCTICPHDQLSRPLHTMDSALYSRIIDECATHGCGEVHLHNFGEPLLDKQLEERIGLAKSRGIRKVKIFSNGSLLTPARAASLLEAGLDEIKISFDGATREEFEAIRAPLKFDKVVENITRLVELRDSRRSRLRIEVACCSTSDRSATMRSLERMVDGFSFGRVHNWSDHDYGASATRIRKPCSRVWRTCTILSDGRIALCCLDYDGKVILGALERGDDIHSIWHGAAYATLRRLHVGARQSEISICANCTKSFV